MRHVPAGAGPWVLRAAPALTTVVIAVPLLLVVHRRRPGVLALERPRQAVVGAAVVLTAAAVVFGVDAALGGTRVTAVDVPALAAFVVTNALLAPAASTALTWAVGSSLDVPVPPATFAPGGQDPVAYAVLLALFGSVLVLARLATRSVWACVAAHLAFLSVNRILVPGFGRDTGVSVQSAPGAEPLVLAYLTLSALAFAVMVRRRRGGGDARTTAVPAR